MGAAYVFFPRPEKLRLKHKAVKALGQQRRGSRHQLLREKHWFTKRKHWFTKRAVERRQGLCRMCWQQLGSGKFKIVDLLSASYSCANLWFKPVCCIPLPEWIKSTWRSCLSHINQLLVYQVPIAVRYFVLTCLAIEDLRRNPDKEW